MARRSGLGRGLGALIPTEVSGERGSALLEIPVNTIRPNPHQPRSAFDEESLASLTASIREVGVLQPILVRDLGNGEYELVAGERRWRAAKTGRPARHPGDRENGQRAPQRRAGSDREPPPPGPQPARGGRRLPAAHRGLRSDPRTALGTGGPEPGRDHQHPSPLPTPADGAEAGQRRAAERWTCPGAARDPGPSLPGGSGPQGGRASRCRCRAVEDAVKARNELGVSEPAPCRSNRGPATSPRDIGARGAPVRSPRHPGQGRPRRQEGPGDHRLRNPRGPGTDLPGDDRGADTGLIPRPETAQDPLAN